VEEKPTSGKTLEEGRSFSSRVRKNRLPSGGGEGGRNFFPAPRCARGLRDAGEKGRGAVASYTEGEPSASKKKVSPDALGKKSRSPT